MPNLRRLSITWLLTALLLATVLVYSIVSVTFGHFAEKGAAAAIAKKQLETLSLVIAQHFATRIQLDGKSEFIAAYVDDLEQLREGLEVRVYRAESTAEIFGKASDRYHPDEPPVDVQDAFTSGNPQFFETDKILRFARPVRATEACLRCHDNAQTGDVLGVVTVASVSHIMRATIKKFQRGYLFINYLVSVIMFLLVFLLVERLLAEPVRRLSRQMVKSRESSDNSDLPHPDTLYCHEMQELNNSFGELMCRLRDRYALMHEMAHTDALTGLLNRRGFVPRFELELHRAKRYEHHLALIAVDLNGFKAINDDCGHAAGDHCLAGVADAVSNMLREEAVLARVGGDEFLAVVPNLAPTDKAQEIAERIAAAVASVAINCGDDERFVTASIGVAIYPLDGADIAQLERVADQRMYDTKARSRHR
ncbi:diguanylate cyclase (GGDEF) domain-containing protein [Thiorhodovibrio frisius]|uniref:Diguanylate cyclase (GGDEF) domain-containing protein n=2 Tax=Thiorhodovibrio frisius TaxID=631362 RepID=H8Z8F9_9GAMM|nr:diguanylate cyclase [Thiorhodovibrio frisius]EIC19364.1 diguanylate cyclase (GGDEF) domain-containing protein [Thiorhodovibrio frisius]WPL22337.1 Bacteriophytochrome cph2 [Thiorhodovibrio frisius]